MWLVAAVAVALLVPPWAIALARARHHHLDATAVTILAAVSIPLAALWLAWVTLAKGGESSAPAGSLSIAEVADQLAIAVGKQWADEAAIRRLNDPYPLPVSWDAADASLTDPWDLLVKLASSGAGWPSPPAPGIWAADPHGLAGEGGQLAEVLAKVPTGRLVVLGEPGSGKTMLMVRLVLDLLKNRGDGEPVPILASIASWNPAEQDLRDWLCAQLLIDHPGLATSPPEGMGERTRAEALLESRLILPVLDGLDEIPNEVRGPAIGRINDALLPGQQAVATCRSMEYREAVRPVGGVEVTLRAAAAVELRPLDADAVRKYLREDAAGPVARARWDPVLPVLGTEAPAGRALSTPLMVSLARAIYNPRPGELAGTLRDPAELCDQSDQTAVESLLFDAFIPAAYRHGLAGRWKAQDAEKWLVFLAREARHYGDLAWWKLSAASHYVATFPAMFWPRSFVVTTIWPPWSRGPMARWMLPARAISVTSSVTSPKAGLALARKAAVVNGPVTGVVFGVVLGVVFGFELGIAAGVWAGVGAGIAAGAGGSFMVPWPWYEMARTSLALRHRLPWRLMDFLEDAHRRGVLRQAGTVYQFRHIELQHRLAGRP